MAWKLEIWFGYDGWDGAGSPAIDEDFGTKAAGVTRAEENIADGYTVTTDGVYHHFPASAVTHVRLGEYEPEE